MREEYERLSGLLSAMEMALRLSTESFLDERAGRRAALPGSAPGVHSPQLEWEDYFITQGHMALLEARRVRPEEPTLFEAVA